MMHFFSLITHTKVAKIVLSGELANSSPLAILLKGFFLLKYFYKKKGFSELLLNIIRKSI